MPEIVVTVATDVGDLATAGVNFLGQAPSTDNVVTISSTSGKQIMTLYGRRSGMMLQGSASPRV